MRVLHVIDSLAASGGAEQGLVREISRFEGIEQKVALLYDRTDLAPEVESLGIPVEVLGLAEGTGSRTWPRAVLPLRRLTQAFRPDVIQTSLFLGNIVGQLVGRSLRIPVVSNLVLSGDPEQLRSFQPRADTRRADLLRSIAGWAARSPRVQFRALTDDVKETNAALLGVDPTRITVIPRGVPRPDLEHLATREQLGLPEGPLVVNVGRLATQKGQTYLVDAFKTVHESVPGAHLVIVGRDGPAASEVNERIRRHGLADSVHLVGHSSQVTSYLTEANVFAFPSVMEGLGTSVLEAMAVGVPVVAFDIPPVREATADGRFGKLLPVSDVDALSYALIPLLRGGREVDLAARDWVREHHDLALVSRRVQALLQTVAGVESETG